MELSLAQFTKGSTRLYPYDPIGDDICVSFDPKTKMTCMARVEEGHDAFGTPTPYLVLSGESRKPDAWLRIELTVPSDVDHVTLRLRCYPAETISPVVYVKQGPSISTRVLVDEPANDDFFAVRIPASTWQGHEAKTVRIGLSIKTSHWYALGLMSVETAGGNHA